MKTYKLIQRYPGIQDYIKLGDEATQLYENGNYICNISNYRLMKTEVEGWPKHWEEIKIPIFKTHDGFEIFENMKDYIIVVNSDFEIIYRGKYYTNQNLEDYTVFSHITLAEKWLDDNKPTFSKNNIREAIKNSTSGVNPFVSVKSHLNDELKL